MEPERENTASERDMFSYGKCYNLTRLGLELFVLRLVLALGDEQEPWRTNICQCS